MISLFGSLQALLLGLAIFVRIGASTERVGSPDGVLMIVFGAAVVDDVAGSRQDGDSADGIGSARLGWKHPDE